MWMEETIGTRINENRTEETIQTGASTVATGCPFCMTMISDGIATKGKSESMQAKDVAELVLEAVEAVQTTTIHTPLSFPEELQGHAFIYFQN